MPRLGENHLHQSLLSFLKNDTVKFEDNFVFTFLLVIKPESPYRVCNTDYIMPGFVKHFISNNFYLVV